jgi:hypothetical protein
MAGNDPEYGTVAWAIQQLQAYPPTATLRFATGVNHEVKWVSDYTDQTGYVWIDLEHAEPV